MMPTALGGQILRRRRVGNGPLAEHDQDVPVGWHSAYQGGDDA